MRRIISFVTRVVPRHYLHRFSHLCLLLISPFYYGKRYEDPISGKTYRKLLPYGRVKIRENALCLHTMSLERHRLLWLFMKEKTNIFTDKLRFLHIAPEYCFIKPFKKLANLEYITADLISPWADIKMDIQDIPLEENSVDAVMCNHVLEHVQDDHKAMTEFVRILKPGGWGIFQVPIDESRELTWGNDPEVNTPALREEHYWQSDHVRLYGLDYSKKLEAAGFEVTEDDFMDSLAPELIERYALIPDEKVYFCRKPLH